VFIEANNDGSGGDNWTTGAISRAKLQSNHRHQQTNIQFFTDRIFTSHTKFFLILQTPRLWEIKWPWS